MKYKFSPWLSVDGEPVGDMQEGGGGSQSVSYEEFQALQQELSGKNELIDKLRQIERRQRAFEATLGTNDPEQLQEMKQKSQRLEQQLQEQLAKEEEMQSTIRASVLQEFEPKIQSLTQENQQLLAEKQKIADEYELYDAFNKTGGMGGRFEGFTALAGQYFYRSQKGEMQVKDSKGETIYNEETGKPVTPVEFMNLLASNKLPEKYVLSQKDMIQQTFTAYNKAMGANLPSSNGMPSGKALSEMSQSELAKFAFKP